MKTARVSTEPGGGTTPGQEPIGIFARLRQNTWLQRS